MNEKKKKSSKKRIKFAPLEMEDRFIDGDHHDEFDYKADDTTNNKGKQHDDISTTTASTAAMENAVTGGPSSSVDPHAHGLGGDLKSAVLGIVKGMVGPAILYLPHGFAQAGWVIAVPMLFASTALYLASSASLLECWKVETTNNKRMSERGGDDNNNNGCNTDTSGTSTIRGGEEETNNTVIEMKELRKSNSHNFSGEKFDNEYIDGGALIAAGISSTAATATATFTTASYPHLAYKAYGPRGETIVKIGIAAMQSGVCLTYLIFVPQNMKSSVRFLFNIDISTSIFLWAMVIVQIPLSWIRDIRHLTVTNALANALIMYGLITCLVFAFENAIVPYEEVQQQDDEGEDENVYEYTDRGPLASILYKFFHLNPFNSDGWFLFIGTSVLLFEGSITLLIPLQEAVAAPHDRQYFPQMYPNVILCIIWFYTFFGIFCWMSFGDDVHTVMTTSLPNTNLATTVQLAYSVAVMLTFPLQNFPSLEIACTAIASVLQRASTTVTVQSSNMFIIRILRILQRREVLSSLLVVLLGLVAIITMERLDKVVSLMGGLLGCPLAFVFPPLIHNKLALALPGSGNGSGGYYLTDRRRMQNKIVASLGFGAMVVATVATILKW